MWFHDMDLLGRFNLWQVRHVSVSMSCQCDIDVMIDLTPWPLMYLHVIVCPWLSFPCSNITTGTNAHSGTQWTGPPTRIPRSPTEYKHMSNHWNQLSYAPALATISWRRPRNHVNHVTCDTCFCCVCVCVYVWCSEFHIFRGYSIVSVILYPVLQAVYKVCMRCCALIACQHACHTEHHPDPDHDLPWPDLTWPCCGD